jgi:flavin reductase (DIM6/NTAB) family NADH-FMN oxidoreductase RutF
MEEHALLISGMTPTNYRRAMGRIPTSVVIAGGMVDGRPVGMVIGTFTSVSLDPPLVGFFGDHRSETLPHLLEAGRWSFSVLDQHDLATCDMFRGPIAERYANLAWSVSELGTPHLDSAVLTIDAEFYSVSPAGDHDAVLGLVLKVTTGDPMSRPLVFQSGRLARLDPGQMLDREIWQLGWDL